MQRDYIAGNERALARLRTLIARLSEDEMQRPMSDGWTVAAYFGHLAFWDRRVSRLAERWLRDGYEQSTYDAHIINDAMKPTLLLVPPAAAAQEALAAAEEVDRVVANLPDHLLEKILAGIGFSVNRAHHRNLHLDEIEALFG